MLFRRLAVLTLLAGFCLPANVWAGEPRAVLRGPTTAAPDAEFWLKFTGSASDKPIVLELAQGPEPITPALLYSREGTPIYAIASATKPGSYIFALIAEGTDGGNQPKRAYAFWTVTVGGPSPIPEPGPPPTPTPTPVPPPVPVPVPVPTPDPVFPPGRFGLSKVAYDLGRTLIPASIDRAKVGSALALSFRVEAGQVGSTIADPARLLELTRARNLEAVTTAGGTREAMVPFFARLADEIYKRAVTGAPAAPTYAWTLADFAAAWKEIADGLEKVQ